MPAARPIYSALVAAIPARVRAATPPSLQQWVPGETPISSVSSVVTAAVLYLSLVFGLQAFMRTRPPAGKGRVFKSVFLLHNILLTLGSALLLALILEDVLPIWRHAGILHAVCSPKAWTPHLESYYLANYYFKYWELADTIFLVLKKKPLLFLHVYHHAATAALCFTQLGGQTSVSWVVISLNLAVHVLMCTFLPSCSSCSPKCPLLTQRRLLLRSV